MVMEDADAKEDNTFSDFTLGEAKEIKIWMIDRETFSTPLLMFSLMCYCNPFIEMVWYLEHQVKRSDFGISKIIRHN